MTDTAERALRVAEHAVHDYAPGQERPLLDHAALAGVYGAAVAGLSLVVKRRVKRLPDRIPAADLALLSVATHKLSRLLTKDAVTAPPRYLANDSQIRELVDQLVCRPKCNLELVPYQRDI